LVAVVAGPLPIRVAIAGSGGRMGQVLIDAVLAARDLTLAGALEISGSALLGKDAGERTGRATGARITADIAAGIRDANVLIDFTRPEATLSNLAACASAGVGAVVGTTGLSVADTEKMRGHARVIPIVYAPNMSVGVNVLIRLVEVAAQRLGDDYDVEVVEMHHRHKVDAPSGTALRLGQAAASSLGRDLKSVGVYAREGVTGARPARAIGFASLRGGDVIGDHTVVFAGDGERIELTHRAGSRMNFAQGALRAARFVASRHTQPGLYDMQDVLGLR
jgi:4-hydroxy-tetrahydrodipicolinate reductase